MNTNVFTLLIYASLATEKNMAYIYKVLVASTNKIRWELCEYKRTLGLGHTLLYTAYISEQIL